MDIHLFLKELPFVDYSHPLIQEKVHELFDGMTDEVAISKKAYTFVRDEIPHSFDIGADVVTAKASDVLKYHTGICHAKSNLLAALLRAKGIPTGFCFQNLTLLDDDSKGYAIHCFNAIYLKDQWIKVDARGNKKGVNAQFSMEKPQLAFSMRPQYNEFMFKGIFAKPDTETMLRLERAQSLDEIINYGVNRLTRELSIEPDYIEK